MNYIGTDIHISTLDFKVIGDSGKLKMANKVQTSELNFINFVKSVPKPRQVIIEEGPLAAWFLEMCVENREQLVITDPKQNHWIGRSGKKEDAIDAEKLAQLARGGYIKEIHHPSGQRRRFRELVQAYHNTNKSIVRVKNQIKAKFLQNGIACPGQTIYMPKQRTEWRNKLPQVPVLLVIVESYWKELDQIEVSLENILTEMKLEAKAYPEIKLIDEIPGVGFIIAATIIAILETPHRFADKRKVWAYSGFGINKKSSANKIYSEKLGKEYNRLLKCVVEQAALAAINADNDNAFRRNYLEMTINKGIAPQHAKLTVSRDIIATAWAMWKKEEHYNPDIERKLKTEVEA